MIFTVDNIQSYQNNSFLSLNKKKQVSIILLSKLTEFKLKVKVENCKQQFLNPVLKIGL